ncbi:phosphodiesterase [Desulfonema ishimotonii]|uniref:Phosphoesterase n=1 Tax=Desulfonema ishimotonii TaxID=45657 RepID=A0A401FS27_9BACT|nr:metallophosphoesterase family protein [Desulfonema ishimotonii]GBC59765.1 phosphodiesterase [Desulfonema ishimotonii]
MHMKLNGKDKYTIGVISDTHGLLRPGAYEILKGADLIAHAGDVGGAEILRELEKIAPVVAVRGNTDGGNWAGGLPEEEVFEVGETLMYIRHDLHRMQIDPAGAKFDVVITGHTHQPAVQQKDRVLFLNPGSAGPRRFDYPVSVAILRVSGLSVSPEIIKLSNL